MKVSIKSSGLDLELDDVKKLDDVLDFITRFKKIELEAEAARQQIQLEAAKAISEIGQRTVKSKK